MFPLWDVNVRYDKSLFDATLVPLKLTIETKLPNGDTAKRRFWGVSFHAEKRKLKAAYRPEVIGHDPDGTPITDEDTPAHDLRLQEMGQEMSWGDPDFTPDTVTRACYITRIRLLGAQRHVGTAALPQTAARLYDSALFHCWGWSKRPVAHFNYYRPGIDPDPPLLPKVRELQMKLRLEARRKGLDTDAFSYTFAQRNEI